MFYEKKYPLTHVKGDYVTLSWERGYKNTQLFYNERELIKIDSIQKLKEGVSFVDSILGNIELKFSDKPMSIDVIIDGYHSPINKSHPEKKIKSIGSYFYMFASFSFIYYFLIVFFTQGFFGKVVLSIEEFIFISLYAVCGYFAGKGKVWAVYTGFSVYSFVTLIILLLLLASIIGPIKFITPFSGFIVLLFRVVFIVFMIPYLKIASSLTKHRRFNVQNPNILDENI